MTYHLVALHDAANKALGVPVVASPHGGFHHGHNLNYGKGRKQINDTENCPPNVTSLNLFFNKSFFFFMFFFRLMVKWRHFDHAFAVVTHGTGHGKRWHSAVRSPWDSAWSRTSRGTWTRTAPSARAPPAAPPGRRSLRHRPSHHHLGKSTSAYVAVVKNGSPK